MLVSLMRAMKPKILESFKDYNAQKEFLAKLSTNKQITVVLTDDKNIIYQFKPLPNNKVLKINPSIIVYNIYKNKIKV